MDHSDDTVIMPMIRAFAAQYQRAQQTYKPSDLQDAISLAQEVLDLCPPGHQLRFPATNNLAAALLLRHEQSGDASDLDDIIHLQQQALELVPPGHSDRSMGLNNLAVSLESRSELTGAVKDSDDAIAYQRQALELRGMGHPLRRTTLTNLAKFLRTRYEQGKDLDEGTQLPTEIVGMEDHDDRSDDFHALASALRTRYGHKRDVDNLDASIEYYRMALQLCPPGHPDRSSSLSALAAVLHFRYKRSGDKLDLEAAMSHIEEALQLLGEHNPARPWPLNILGHVLISRYVSKNNVTDLNRAIECHQEAVEFLQDPLRSSSLDGLATALFTRYETAGDMTDLEDVIKYHREAFKIHSTTPNHIDMPVSCNNLAIALVSRFKRKGDRADLEEAIAYQETALELRPPGHFLRAKTQMLLADFLWQAGISVSETNKQGGILYSDSGRSFGLLEEAAKDTRGPVAHRLSAAIVWAEGARSCGHKSTMTAYSLALELLDTAVVLARSVEGGRSKLVTDEIFESGRNLATDAASYAIETRDVVRALEVLEHGRTILFKHLGWYRTPLDALLESGSDAKHLAERFQELALQLHRSTVLDESLSITQGLEQSSQDEVARYQGTLSQFMSVINEIRSIDGFERFMKPTPFDVFQRAAVAGPVIVLNISRYHSSAIIVNGGDRPHLKIIKLSAASPEAVSSLAERLSKTIDGRENSSASQTRLELTSILRSLWTIIVGPIVKVLEEDIAHGSRIWWSPTLSAWRLPLHAAGPYETGSRNLPDRYVSSYTPTMTTLLRSQKPYVDTQGSTPKLLLVAQPNMQGRSPLPGTMDEVRLIQQKSVLNTTLLESNQGTRDAVLEALQHHPWVHLACHGNIKLSNPFHSNFSLYDQPLTLLDIMKTGLPRAELAVLSACHTAAGNSGTPDEALHLAAGMQFAGFRSVVGTLWEIADEDAPIVAQKFYTRILGGAGDSPDCTNAAKALHSAVRELRLKAVPLDRWICFVHYGA